jgi:4-amino-4-deoxy-L-arabinose transferase-like glycosyltransferase
VAAAAVAVLAALLAWHAGDPWRYLHDDNGRRYSSYARTHHALGLRATGGHDFFLDRRDGRLIPYGHHPPTLGILLAGWFRATGDDGPRTARALPACFHLASAVLLLGILRRQYPALPGAVAALAFAGVPMSAYFGKLVNFEPVVLPFVIGAVVGWWRWAETGSRAALALAGILVAVGTLVDWPMLLVAVVLVGDGVRRWRRGEGARLARGALAVAAVAAAVGVGVALWASRPVGGDELGRAIGFRVRMHGYPWWRLAGHLIDYNRRYFTEPVSLASVAAGALLFRKARRDGVLAARERLLVLFAAVGMLPVIAFPTSARYHPYWQFYLLPYTTLALAYVLEELGTRMSSRARGMVHAAVLLAIVVSAGVTLAGRYARPSGYVARQVRAFQHYL